MNTGQIKYIQSGTGQVGYLLHDDSRQKWVFELFTGGPEPRHEFGTWDARVEADAALREAGFVAAGG